MKIGRNYTDDASLQNADGYILCPSGTDQRLLRPAKHRPDEVESVLLRHGPLPSGGRHPAEERGQIVKAL